MSLLSTWTIPTDPGFQTRRSEGTETRESDLKRAKPRVKPEAMSFALKNQGTVAQLFNPYSKPHHMGSSRSAKNETKRDFLKENAREIRRIEKSNQESARDSARSTGSVRTMKSDRYEHVESKVAQELKFPRYSNSKLKLRYQGEWEPGTFLLHGSPMAPRSTSSSFLKKHIRSGSPVPDKPVSVRSVVPPKDKLSIPSVRSDTNKGQEKRKEGKVNHISRNIRQCTSSPVLRRRPPSTVATEQLEKKKAEEEQKYKRGHVPNYLRKRQEQWKEEEEERIRNMPDPSIPPGHTLMPREERLQTLELLRKKHKEMTVELNSLPVSCDTLRIKTRKTELEKKLREIESAVKIFSRPKVFVKADT